MSISRVEPDTIDRANCRKAPINGGEDDGFPSFYGQFGDSMCFLQIAIKWATMALSICRLLAILVRRAFQFRTRTTPAQSQTTRIASNEQEHTQTHVFPNSN